MSTLQNSAILWIVEKLVEESVFLKGNQAPERRGGYLTVLVYDEMQISLCSAVGIFEDADACRALSLEQARRLKVRSAKHLLSFESRNPLIRRYGGAICVKKRIISFAGPLEFVSEAIVTAAAYWLGEITEYSQVVKIADISRNPFTEELIARMANWPSLAEFENFPS